MARTLPPEVREFEARLRRLLAAPLDDAALRTELERLAADRLFSGFTHVWGPVLYARNRVMFRPFILAHFATWLPDGGHFSENVTWKSSAAALDAWLDEVDRRDDVELFRKLYRWKHTSAQWELVNQKTWRDDLVARFQAAANRHQRHTVLAKFAMPATLDEPAALELDAVDPEATRAFILEHLPRSWFRDQSKRTLWGKLYEQALRRGDIELAYALYRKQVPLREWKADVVVHCDDVDDPAVLCRELERRHPEGWGLDLGDGLHQALRRRGRDVLPYIKRHLRDVWGGWRLWSSFEPMLDLAERHGWLDLWSGLIRVSSRGDRFDDEVARLVRDTTLGADESRRRLGMLAGVSREWNLPGLGLAQVKPLEDTTAVLFYRRFPDLVRGPFRMHVSSSVWGESYDALTREALNAGDEVLVDFLASRLVTRPEYPWPSARRAVKLAEWLSEHYELLRDSAPDAFALRAAAVLGQVPAYSIHSYDRLIQTNRLARLLFERSSASFLDDPNALRDLLEAPEIHVQALALRALGLDDDRARTLAAVNLDLLQATLLRPLHRRTRLLAFPALFNAACTSESARRVVARARQALDLPDKRYPKEALVGLIGRLIHAWPELRSERERPVVYGMAEAEA
jgi:hypothetical protein